MHRDIRGVHGEFNFTKRRHWKIFTRANNHKKSLKLQCAAEWWKCDCIREINSLCLTMNVCGEDCISWLSYFLTYPKNCFRCTGAREEDDEKTFLGFVVAALQIHYRVLHSRLAADKKYLLWALSKDILQPVSLFNFLLMIQNGALM